MTLLLASVIPLYQYAATGDARQNLYLLVWSYDRVGFGEGYGAHGHTLEKGIRQTGWDLSLTASDLFGWQTGSMFTADNQIKPELKDHLLNQGDYWPPTPSFGLTLPSGDTKDIPFIGLSWVLLPFGLLIGFKRRWWWWTVWLLFGAVLLILTSGLNYPAFGLKMSALPVDLLRDPQFAFIWLGGYVLWMCIPFIFLLLAKPDRQVTWSWLLLAIALSLIGLHITYWIGSQRYSTRYYYEALTAVCIISALPVAWLIRARTGQRVAMEVQTEAEAKLLLSPQSSILSPLIALAFAALLLYSLFAYSLPRIGVLRGFNNVNQSWIAQVEERAGNQPALVIINGSNVRWRAFGSLMASTSPYLDSPIIAAWNFNGSDATRERLLSLFPDRHVIDMDAEEAQATFRDTPVAQGQ